MNEKSSCPVLRGRDDGNIILLLDNLRNANLSGAIVVEANLENAVLSGCSIYGIAAWDVQLQGAEQLNLTITPKGQPIITVDNLKIAQFIYLLLNNAEIRDVIDTITSKVVLILGRFTPERKPFLMRSAMSCAHAITRQSYLTSRNRSART